MQLKNSSKYPGMISQTVNLREKNINILLIVGEYGEKNLQFLQDSLLGKKKICLRFTPELHSTSVCEINHPWDKAEWKWDTFAVQNDGQE